MSLRQVYKHDKLKQESIDFEEVAEIEKEIAKEKSKKPTFSAFQMSESEEENEENSEDEKQAKIKQQSNKESVDDSQAKKKKKKRNKKKKKVQEDQQNQDNANQKPQQVQSKQSSTQDGKKQSQQKNKEGKKEDDLDFLDSIISKQQEEIKQQYGSAALYGQDSVLKMERKNFNFKKELKQLFAKSAQAYGALGLDEEEKEERKNRGNNQDDYEGASKKMRRRLRMVEKIQEKNRVLTSKKYLMVQPDPRWPRVDRMVTMEHVKTDKKTGQKIFSFVKLPDYNVIEKEFKQVQATNDIQNLMHFLQRNFYHHESLVYFADFLRIQGKFSDSFHFLERCLFAFEQAWTFEYQPVSPDKNQEDFFIPQTRMDMEQDHLNKVFAECIVKYIDILGRKGCSKTSLEYCKLLLSLDPYTDLYGSLLRLDFYAVRAHEYQYLLDFIRKLPKEIYPDENSASLLIMPNLLLTSALAKYQIKLGNGSDYKVADLDKTLNILQNIEGSMNQLLDFEPEILVISAIILYPKLIQLLVKKVAQKQINQNNKKAHFNGYQAKTWTDILAHTLFTEIGEDIAGEQSYNWVLNQVEQVKLSQEKQDELTDEVLHKIFSIFVSRSHTLFAPDSILIWLKEVIGFVLNKLDEGAIDRDLMIGKFTSLVQSPFSLSRYRSLKQSDFTDDITTINPNELLMGGGPPGMEDPHNNQVQAEAGIAAQQLQQMINQLNRPPPLHGQMMQQQQQMNPLFQERDLQNMSEQEIVAMQEAILAQMGDNEDIYIDDEENAAANQIINANNDQQQNVQGGGIFNMFNNLFGFGNGNQNQPREEEKKQ